MTATASSRRIPAASARTVPLAVAIRRGTVTPREAVEACLARIEALEERLRAWAQLDLAAARSEADRLTGEARQGRFRGPLHGVPIAVKDVIDAAGLPTRAASAALADASPATADATVVGRLRTAGAVVLGKTWTTEFAYRDPAPTRNPYALEHTPGGSSSGSGAAVSAGMVPLALGTQTAGSTCRPAAYCGIAAIKPTYGLLPLDGVKPLAPSFDTVGCFGRKVEDAALAFAVMAERDALTDGAESAAPEATSTLGVLDDRFHRETVEEVRDFHFGTIGRLAARGFRFESVELPVDLEKVVADHRTVMYAEMWRGYERLYRERGDRLGRHFREALQTGARIPAAACEEARGRLAEAKRAVWASLGGVGALLLQPVPAPAPRGLASTGNQRYLAPWTAFHGPLVVVPGELGGGGLPLACMVAAPPGEDDQAIAVARTIERCVDRLPDHAPAEG